MQKETKFKTKVLPILKRLPNSWVLKTQEVSRSGVPDILMCLGGTFVTIELKTNEGKVSKLQEYNLKKISEAGGVALVVQPNNFEASIQFLENLAKGGLKNGQRSSIKKGSKRDKTKLQNS